MKKNNLFFVVVTAGLISACGDAGFPDQDTLKILENSTLPTEDFEETSYSLLGLNINEAGSQIEFDALLNVARQENKPVLIDFNGFNCVNCRKMELNVWETREVYPVLEENFMIISLYIDDRDPYPGVDTLEGNRIKTVGDYWKQYEADRYQKNTQPVYDIVDFNNKSLVAGTASYRSHGSPSLFLEWLNEGLANFEQQNI